MTADRPLLVLAAYLSRAPTSSADAFGLCRLRLGLVAALRKRCTRSYEGQPINRAAEGGSFVWIRTVASVTPFSRDGRESVVRSYRCRVPTCGGTKPAAGSALNGPQPNAEPPRALQQ